MIQKEFKTATGETGAWYEGLIDPKSGVQFRIDLTTDTYLWLIASGVVVFLVGGMIWHSIPKLMN